MSNSELVVTGPFRSDCFTTNKCRHMVS